MIAKEFPDLAGLKFIHEETSSSDVSRNCKRVSRFSWIEIVDMTSNDTFTKRYIAKEFPDLAGLKFSAVYKA